MMLCRSDKSLDHSVVKKAVSCEKNVLLTDRLIGVTEVHELVIAELYTDLLEAFS